MIYYIMEKEIVKIERNVRTDIVGDLLEAVYIIRKFCEEQEKKDGSYNFELRRARDLVLDNCAFLMSYEFVKE